MSTEATRAAFRLWAEACATGSVRTHRARDRKVERRGQNWRDMSMRDATARSRNGRTNGKRMRKRMA